MSVTALQDLKLLLNARGLNINKLAESIGGGRAHVSLVLNGHRSGGRTKKLLFAVLQEPEINCLGWAAEYEIWKAKKAAKKSGDPATI